MGGPAVEGRFSNLSGAVLLGGASRRMGRDKAHLQVGGEALATRLARLLQALVEDVVLVGGDPPADAPGRRVSDPPGERSSLRGLVGALAAARHPRCLVLATDLPRLGPEMLLALIARPEADVVLPRSGGFLHPLCGLYRVASVLPVARRRLAAGRLSLAGVLEEVETDRLEGEDLEAVDPEGRQLTNWNEPGDLS